MRRNLLRLGICWSMIAPAWGAKKPAAEQTQSLQDYVQQVHQRARHSSEATAGSLFSSTGRLADNVRDVRASQAADLVTIVVSDKASAVSTGVTNTSRKSSAKASITALGGAIKATRPLANLANMSGNQQLQGQGTTSRDSSLNTTLTAQVTHVLPNG